MEKLHFRGAMHLKSEPSHYHLKREAGQPAYNFVHFLVPVVIVIDSLEIKVDKNACILYTPNTRQEYYALPGGMTNNYVTFEVDDVNFVMQHNIPVNEVFYIERAELITEIVEYISWALVDCFDDHTQDLKERLTLLLSTLSECQIVNTPASRRAFQTKKSFIRLRDEIRLRPKGWTVEKMAKTVYLTRSRFFVLYREFFNTTPSEDLITMTLSYAKKALQQTDIPIADVARECGYDSAAYFIRLFRKRESMTPGEYRRQSRKPT